jgi:predicted phosphodiesterase
MNEKKRLNFYEMWVICQIRGHEVSDYTHDGQSFRPRLTPYETDVIRNLREFFMSPLSNGGIVAIEEDFISVKLTNDSEIFALDMSKCDAKGNSISLSNNLTEAPNEDVLAPTAPIKVDNRWEIIKSRYSDAEIDILTKKENERIIKHTDLNFEGEVVKWLQISDTHLGSKYSKVDELVSAFKYAEREGCQFIAHAGDVFEGMSQRAGHIYELSNIGYTSQLDLGIEVFSQTTLPIKMISGNHDDWFIKSNGAYIVKDLCSRLPNAEYLGEGSGHIYLNGAKYSLYHGEDGGGAYAISYRIQKIVEAYEGGSKPQILGTGHDHKSGYFFIRNVHCFLGGCMQNQTDWMMRTRKSAMKGFWIIEATIKDSQVTRIKTEFIPFYR